MLKWLNLPTGLLGVAIAFTAVSWAGYFGIHELKENDVKRIQKKRVKDVRKHLMDLVKEYAKVDGVTTESEKKFFDLQDEYDKAHEPLKLLRNVDRFLMFSGICFLATILVDWANDNFTFISSQGSPLLPVEYVLFLYGLMLLAFGLLSTERLRRMTSQEEDIDHTAFRGIRLCRFHISD